eukprot:g1315.t1
MGRKRKWTNEEPVASAFAAAAASFMERHGFLLDSQKQLEPEDNSGLAARKLKHFRCRMGDGGPCKTMKFKESDTLKTAILASVSFWGQDGRTNSPLFSLFKQPWVPRVDSCRLKILQLMIRTKQPPEKIARYVLSQYAGKIIFESAPRIPYVDFVRAYARKVPAFQRKLFQHVVENVEKQATAKASWLEGNEVDQEAKAHFLQGIVEKEATKHSMIQKSFVASKAWWLEGNEVDQEAMLCHHSLDCEQAMVCRNMVFDALNFCDKARFAASQIVGYPVLNWYQLIDSNYILSLVPYGPGLEGAKPFFMTKSCFQMLKSRLVEDNGLLETSGKCILLDTMFKNNTCIGVCDLRASYEECVCFRNNYFYQVAWLFRENLNISEFRKSVLSCIKNKSVTLSLSLDIEVKLAFIKNQYIIASILTTRNIQLPKEFNLERLRISTDDHSNFWTYRKYVHKIILYVKGTHVDRRVSLASTIRMYQNYPIFCVLNLENPVGKNMVYKSKGYERRFGDMHRTRPLCGKGLSLGVICDGIVKPILQGKAPNFDMCLQDKYGQHWNHTVRMVISKDFQFMTVIFIEKTMYLLPDSIRKEYEEMEKSDPNNKMRVLEWCWKASKILYQTLRVNEGNMTAEELAKRYPSDSMLFFIDVNGKNFLSSFHYTPAFKKCFRDINFFTKHCQKPETVESAHHVIFNTLLQPVWKGDSPKIIRRVQCCDGIFRWFQMTVSSTATARWYLVLLEETDVPFSGDEVFFGCPDIRPKLHQATRHLLNTKTEPHNEYSCAKFLAWMTQQFGQEDESMYIIVDRHIKDAFQACVYRTKKHIDRYGDYNMLYSLIEQRTFSVTQRYFRTDEMPAPQIE